MEEELEVVYNFLNEKEEGEFANFITVEDFQVRMQDDEFKNDIDELVKSYGGIPVKKKGTESVLADGSSEQPQSDIPEVNLEELQVQDQETEPETPQSLEELTAISKGMKELPYAERGVQSTEMAKDLGEKVVAEEEREEELFSQYQTQKKDLKKSKKDQLKENINFKAEIADLTLSDIAKDEESFQRDFNNKFGKYNLIATQSGMGDAVDIKTTDGVASINIDLQPITKSGSIEELRKLKSFINDNAFGPEYQPLDEAATQAEKDFVEVMDRRGLNGNAILSAQQYQNDIDDKLKLIEKIERVDLGQSILKYGEKDYLKHPELFIKKEQDGETIYVPRPDLDKVKEDLEADFDKSREVLGINFFDTELEDAYKEFDMLAAAKIKDQRNIAATANANLKNQAEIINKESLGLFGVQYNQVTPEMISEFTPYEKERFFNLYKAAEAAKKNSQVAADAYLEADTYLDMQFQKGMVEEFNSQFTTLFDEIEKSYNNGHAITSLVKLAMPSDPLLGEFKFEGAEKQDLKKAAIKLNKFLKRAEEIGTGEAMFRLGQATNVSETVAALASDPIELLPALLASTFAQLLPVGNDIIPYTIGLGGLTGASLGGAFTLGAGAVPATITGLVYGGNTGVALSFGALELGNSILEVGREFGYDPLDPQQAQEMLQNLDVWEAGAARGYRRGAAIAAVDMLASSLTGQFFRGGKVINRTATDKVNTFVKNQLVFGAGAESGGEALAMGLSGQKFEGKEVLLEGVVGLKQRMGSQLANSYFFKSAKKEKQKLADNLQYLDNMMTDTHSLEDLTNWSSNMEKDGQISSEQNQRIQHNIGVKKTVDSYYKEAKNLDPKNTDVKKRLFNLVSAREQLSNMDKNVYSAKIAQINKEIAAIVTTGDMAPADVSVDIDTQPLDTNYVIDGKIVTEQEFKDFIEASSIATLIKSDFSGSVVSDEVNQLFNNKLNIDADQKSSTMEAPSQEQPGVVSQMAGGVPGQVRGAAQAQDLQDQQDEGQEGEVQSREKEINEELKTYIEGEFKKLYEQQFPESTAINRYSKPDSKFTIASNKVKAQESVNDVEMEAAINEGYETLSEIEQDEKLSQEEKDILTDLVEEQITELEAYENLTQTETRKVSKTGTTRVAPTRKTTIVERKTKKTPKGRLFNRQVQVEGKPSNQVTVIEEVDGELVLQDFKGDQRTTSTPLGVKNLSELELVETLTEVESQQQNIESKTKAAIAKKKKQLEAKKAKDLKVEKAKIKNREVAKLRDKKKTLSVLASKEQAQPISKSELKTRIREEQNKTKAAIDRLGKEAEQRLEAELQEELAAFEGTKQATAKTKTKAAQKKFGKEGKVVGAKLRVPQTNEQVQAGEAATTITIMDEEIAIDLAIEEQMAEIGSIETSIIDEVIEEFEKEKEATGEPTKKPKADKKAEPKKPVAKAEPKKAEPKSTKPKQVTKEIKLKFKEEINSPQNRTLKEAVIDMMDFLTVELGLNVSMGGGKGNKPAYDGTNFNFIIDGVEFSVEGSGLQLAGPRSFLDITLDEILQAKEKAEPKRKPMFRQKSKDDMTPDQIGFDAQFTNPTQQPYSPESNSNIQMPIQWVKSKVGENVLQDQSPVLAAAAEQYYQGNITYDEFIEIQKRERPISTIDKYYEPATREEIEFALSKNKIPKIFAETKDGDFVGLRLDIPAYTNHNVWVVTVHEGDGAPTSYTNVAYIKDVKFSSNPKKALAVARKKQSKSPFAKMLGTWVSLGGSPTQKAETAKGLVQTIVNNPDWVQVGFNPQRFSYFYDRANGRPLLSADEVIQIGGLVYAKVNKDSYATSLEADAFEAKDINGRPIYFREGVLADSPVASNALSGLEQLPDNPMTPQAWVKQIAEKGGKGTQREIDEIGLLDFLNTYIENSKKKSIPKAVVEEYIRDNSLVIQEIIKDATQDIKLKFKPLPTSSAIYNESYDFLEKDKTSQEIAKSKFEEQVENVNSLLKQYTEPLDNSLDALEKSLQTLLDDTSEGNYFNSSEEIRQMYNALVKEFKEMYESGSKDFKLSNNVGLAQRRAREFKFFYSVITKSDTDVLSSAQLLKENIEKYRRGDISTLELSQSINELFYKQAQLRSYVIADFFTDPNVNKDTDFYEFETDKKEIKEIRKRLDKVRKEHIGKNNYFFKSTKFYDSKFAGGDPIKQIVGLGEKGSATMLGFQVTSKGILKNLLKAITSDKRLSKKQSRETGKFMKDVPLEAHLFTASEYAERVMTVEAMLNEKDWVFNTIKQAKTPDGTYTVMDAFMDFEGYKASFDENVNLLREKIFLREDGTRTISASKADFDYTISQYPYRVYLTDNRGVTFSLGVASGLTAATDKAQQSYDDLTKGKTVYKYWTVDGYQDYKEVLLILPPTANKDYNYPAKDLGNHWSHNNVLAHARFTTRINKKREKVLVIDELQSDWDRAKIEYGAEVEDMPYMKKDAWLGLTLRRMFKMAADMGFDKVSMGSGAMAQQSVSLKDHSKYDNIFPKQMLIEAKRFDKSAKLTKEDFNLENIRLDLEFGGPADRSLPTIEFTPQMKERLKSKVPLFKSEADYAPVNKDESQIRGLQEGKTTLNQETKMLKGSVGKISPEGKKITRHPNITDPFVTLEPQIAEEYARGGEIIEFTLPKGTTVEVVKVDQKDKSLPKYSLEEEKQIMASDADVVKLITREAKTFKGNFIHEQYVIKNPEIKKTGTTKAETAIDQANKLNEKLQQAFPNVDFNMTQEAFDAVMERPDIRKRQKDGQVLYGISIDENTIYINPAAHNSLSSLFNTQIHEYGHVALDLLETTEEGKQKLAVGLELATEHPLYEKNLKEFEGIYATKAEAEKAAAIETLATLIGDKGEGIANQSLKQRFMSWLKSMYEYFKNTYGSLMGIPVSEVQNLSLDQFVGAVLTDMLSGQVFGKQDIKAPKRAPLARMKLQGVPQQMVEQGRQMGYTNNEIKEYLKSEYSSLKAADIKEMMQVDSDVLSQFNAKFDTVPEIFGNVPGGMKEGIKMLTRIGQRLDSLSADDKSKMSIVRTSAQIFLKDDPLYEFISLDVQEALQVQLDKAFNSKSGTSINQQIHSVNKGLRRGKASLKQAKDSISQLKSFIYNNFPKEAYRKGDLQKVLKLAENINETNYKARLNKAIEIIDRVLEERRVKTINSIAKRVNNLAKFGRISKAKVLKGKLQLSPEGQKFFGASNEIIQAQRIKDPVARANKTAEIAKRYYVVEEVIIKDENGKDVSTKIINFDKLNDKAQKAFDKFNQEIPAVLTPDEENLVFGLAAFDKFYNMATFDQDTLINLLAFIDNKRQTYRADVLANMLARQMLNQEIQRKNEAHLFKTYPEVFAKDKDGNIIYEEKPLTILESKEFMARILEAIPDDFDENKGVTVEVDGREFIVRLDDQANFVIRKKSPAVAQTENLNRRWPNIQRALEDGGVFRATKEMVKKIKDQPILFFHDFMFMGGWLDSTLSITNSLDNKDRGQFFTENLYDRSVDMQRRALRGKQLQLQTIGLMADDLINLKDPNLFVKGVQRLALQDRNPLELVQELERIKKIYDVPMGNGETKKFSGSNLMRIYALSLNEEQREKMMMANRPPVTQETIEFIKDKLEPDVINFIEEVVNYLTTPYYMRVNKVYKKVNNVNLERIQNYFPTMSDNVFSQENPLNFESNFFGKFSSQWQDALKKRNDLKSPVLLDVGFFDTLENHFESMESFVNMAEDVQDLNAFFTDPNMANFLRATGYGPSLRQSLNIIINPEDKSQEVSNKYINKIFSNFVGYVLGAKLIQLVKQSTSFIFGFAAFGNQNKKLVKETNLDSGKVAYEVDKRIPKDLGIVSSGFELVEFLARFANILNPFNFKKEIQEAKEISPFFKERTRRAALLKREAGRGVRQKSTRQGVFQILNDINTFLGDIIGVLGYKAAYNKDIDSGMDKAAAAKKFDRYNNTQQTQLISDLNKLQLSRNSLMKVITTFGSTIYLAQQIAFMSMVNIAKDIYLRKLPSKKDIRVGAISLGLAQLAFVFVSNAARILGNDDEEEVEDVMKELTKATYGFNLLTQIPVIGGGVKIGAAVADGKSPFSVKPSAVDPITRIALETGKNVKKIMKEDATQRQIFEASKGLLSVLVGAFTGKNIRPLLDLLTAISVDDLATKYNNALGALGISPSYRPTKIKKAAADEASLTEEERMSKDMGSGLEDFNDAKQNINNNYNDVYKELLGEEEEEEDKE